MGRIARQIRDQPVAPRQPVAAAVVVQEFDLHARHVDAGRAFALAAFAGDAEVHRLAHLRRDLAGQRDGHTGEPARDRLADAALVLRIGEAVQQADRDGLDALRDVDAILFGSAGDPHIPDHVTLWGLRLKICQGLDQYANVRPTRILPGIVSPLRGCAPRDLDWVIVRENSEGEYSGVGGRVHQRDQRALRRHRRRLSGPLLDRMDLVVDVRRPAAMEQLAVLGRDAGIETLPVVEGQQPAQIAKRALEAARLGGFDVVLLDTMGDPGDTSTLAVIRSASPATKVVIYSGYVALLGEEALPRADAFLDKGADHEELVAAIRSVIAAS